MTASKEPESPIKFPCDYLVKVMGEDAPDFERKVLNILKRHSKRVHVEKLTKRHSKNHKYLSISVTLHLENKAQLDSLYLELRETPDILMAL